MLRNIVFAAPSPSYDVMRFVRALSKLEGIRLLGVFGRSSKELASLCTAVALVATPPCIQVLPYHVAAEGVIALACLTSWRRSAAPQRRRSPDLRCGRNRLPRMLQPRDQSTRG